MAQLGAARDKAFEKLNITPGHKLILCLDGGGVRGILTLKLLQRLEAEADLPCYQLFDMVSGTSTGGIIAGLIASGKTATEVEELYTNLIHKVFKRRVLGDRFFNPPAYEKAYYRALLKSTVGEKTLQETCLTGKMDLMITAKDVAGSEQTYFSCFREIKDQDINFIGFYKDVQLRAVMEATMSAPTYFSPFERFVDGGLTVHNNPVLSTIMEAVNYGPKGSYQLNKLTVFSFGTGIKVQFNNAKDIHNPGGLDSKFWLNYILTETGQDASELQNDTVRNLLRLLPVGEGGFDFRRFQLSLDQDTMRKLPGRDISNIPAAHADSLFELTNEDIGTIQLDDLATIPLLQVIGEAMAEYIVTKGGSFTKDLVNESGRDLLVSTRGDRDLIKGRLASSKWIDEQPSF